MARIKNTKDSLEKILIEENFRIIGRQNERADFILTSEVTAQFCSEKLGEFFAENSVDIHYINDYLKARNWIQLAFMGHLTEIDTDAFAKLLKKFLKEAS